MTIALKGLTGAYKNVIFPLRPGFKIGRTQGDLKLDDGKVSSQHAYVDITDSGGLKLIDQRSKNGLRVNGVKKDSVLLEPGVQILIGQHLFEVVIEDASANDATVVAPRPAPAMGAGVPPPVDLAPTPPPKARYWNDVIAQFGQVNLSEIKNKVKALVPLKPAVVLDFVRGTQIDTRWVLGYGPRRIGYQSIDLPIYEAGAPDVCFEIIPTPDGISFKTRHPQVVKLNGNSTSQEILRIGDVIQILDTEIEVDFSE